MISLILSLIVSLPSPSLPRRAEIVISASSDRRYYLVDGPLAGVVVEEMWNVWVPNWQTGFFANRMQAERDIRSSTNGFAIPAERLWEVLRACRGLGIPYRILLDWA